VTVAEAVTLIAALGAFLVAAAGAFVSVWNAIHLAQVHTIVNSQATKFELLATRAGFAEGVSATSSPATTPSQLAAADATRSTS
jgi:hypothetical protein